MGTAGSDWGTFCITWEHLRAKHENFAFQGASPIQVLIVVIGQHFGHIDLNIMLFGKIYSVLSLGLLVAIYAPWGTFFACGFGLGNAPALFSALFQAPIQVEAC